MEKCSLLRKSWVSSLQMQPLPIQSLISRASNLQLHMFANLATLPKPLISISSLLSLLNQSFIFVLENEFSLRAERGDELVRVVLETLLRIPSEYLQGQNETLDAIRNGLGNYMGSRSLDLAFLGDKINESQWIDVSSPLMQYTRSIHGA